jgi:hypothetical protein
MEHRIGYLKATKIPVCNIYISQKRIFSKNYVSFTKTITSSIEERSIHYLNQKTGREEASLKN